MTDLRGHSIGPYLLPVIAAFAILYLPFLFRHGFLLLNFDKTDLPSFWTASVQAFRNHGSPYDREALQQLMGQEIYVFPYLYPPPRLFFLFPLSLVSYPAARLMALLSNHVMILLLLIAIPLYLLPSKSKASFYCLFLLTSASLLSFNAMILTLNHGQVNILLLLLLVGFWVFARAGIAGLASLSLAMAILLKLYPVIILAALPIIGRKREFIYTTSFLGAIAGLSLFALPASTWTDWMQRVILPRPEDQKDTSELLLSTGNQSLHGFLNRTLNNSSLFNSQLAGLDLAKLVTYASCGVILCASMVVIFWASRQPRLSKLSIIDRMMIVFLPATFLIAPLSWEHHLILLAPVNLLLVSTRFKLSKAANWLYYATSVGLTVYIGANIATEHKFWGVLGLWLLCILVACCAVEGGQEGLQDPAPSRQLVMPPPAT